VSTILGGLYWIVLGRAYAAGEVGLIYPLAYGSAPIWILMLSSTVFQETLQPQILAVIVLISAGLFIVLFSSADSSKLLDRNVFLRSASVTVIIIAYTLCDALAVRTVGNPVGYTIFLYASSGALVLLYALTFHKKRVAKAFASNRYIGVLWGGVSLITYCGELWAMTRAPVALVAALRETSILFAIAIAIVWLREPIKRGRIAGAGVVALGLVLMRLS
jgi:drug/metabolite transporter (DMT)-like permease